MIKNKKSSYQKVKDERDYLLTVLRTIAKNPNTNESKILLMRYKFLSDIEDAVMNGDSTSQKDTSLLSRLQSQE